MTNSVDQIAEQLFKVIKGYGHAIVLFTDDGKKTADPAEARRIYAKDIQMMVNFVVDETTNEIIVNLSKDTEIKSVQPMLSAIRQIASRHIIEYTVKTFGKSIAPKDFAYQAKTIGEATMDEGATTSETKRRYDRAQQKLATLSKARNAAKKAGTPWKAADRKEQEYFHFKTIVDKPTSESAFDSAINEIDCWDGYKKQGTKKGTGKNKNKRVNNCVPESLDDENKDNPMNKHTPLNGREQEILRRISKNVIDAPINHQKNVRPVFHSLKRKGLIEPFVKDGIVRKGYVITTKGKDMLGEGFSGWSGSARKSVNQLESARIIVKHKRSVDEEKRGARTRQIESIFIENVEGERFKFPSTNITAAKAMARHVQEGGAPFDDFGQHIYGIMEELTQLKTFHRKNKRNDFFEDAAISEEIGTHISNLRSSLKSMAGKNSYSKQFESFNKESEEISQERIDELKDATTMSYFDESIAESLPYVARVIESLRKRQASESHIVEFARQVMNSTTGFTLSESCDDDDPEGPAACTYKDQVSEVVAWAAYLSPKVQNEALSTSMAQLEEDLSAVSGKHVNMAMAAINVIKQQGTVAEAEAAPKVDSAAAEFAQISETFDKYDIRKIFGV
jgi:DNA-binding PadR family transcriptional regulator